MRTENFPSCCGLTLLTQFGNTNAALDSNNYSVEEVDAFLKQNNYWNTGVMATLNTPQYKKLSQVFLDNGFKLISQFYYGGHGNDIYILLKTTEKNIRQPKIYNNEISF